MVRAEVREANRPPAPVPRELWVVIGLLVAAGGVMLYQTVPMVPDVVGFTFNGSPFESLGLFFVAYLVELSLLGVGLLGLAYGLYRGHASARLSAAVVCGAIGVSYVLQEHRADTENWEMFLALAIAATLAMAPALRAWAVAQSGQSEPTPVAAALAISSVMGVALGILGLTLLAATPVDGAFGLIGAGLCIGGIVLFRSLGGVRAGDVEARHLLSGLMVGYVMLLLLARFEVSAAEALIVPITLAGSVVALLWFPPASQIHFGLHSTEPERRATPPPPPPRAEPPPPAPLPRVEAPAPAAAPVAVSKPPPPDLHVVVGVVAGSRMAKSSSLHLMYDQQSWFPAPAPDERVVGAYLVFMLLHGGGGPRDRIFEGTSSLLISERRLAGVCPKGTGPHGPLDAARGPVIPWSVPFDELSDVATATSRSGTYLAMSATGHSGTRILLAKPRIVRGGGFVPVDIAQLARDLSRARRSGVPAREMVAR